MENLIRFDLSFIWVIYPFPVYRLMLVALPIVLVDKSKRWLALLMVTYRRNLCGLTWPHWSPPPPNESRDKHPDVTPPAENIIQCSGASRVPEADLSGQRTPRKKKLYQSVQRQQAHIFLTVQTERAHLSRPSLSILPLVAILPTGKRCIVSLTVASSEALHLWQEEEEKGLQCLLNHTTNPLNGQD